MLAAEGGTVQVKTEISEVTVFNTNLWMLFRRDSFATHPPHRPSTLHLGRRRGASQLRQVTLPTTGGLSQYPTAAKKTSAT